MDCPLFRVVILMENLEKLDKLGNQRRSAKSWRESRKLVKSRWDLSSQGKFRAVINAIILPFGEWEYYSLQA